MIRELFGGLGQPQDHTTSASSESQSPGLGHFPVPSQRYQVPPQPVRDRTIGPTGHSHRHRSKHSGHQNRHRDRSSRDIARDPSPASVIYRLVSPQPQLLPSFQYSKCTGKKKALCIGINYYGQSDQLYGCINDAKNVRKFLIDTWGYNSRDIVLLRDDSRNPRSLPTKANIQDAMRWLVAGAQPHDALFFHYSGHGGQTEDLDGDEVDGYDQVIYPVDSDQNGHIIDDEMHDIMVESLPIGCRLTAIFDCCYSGSVLDLPYMYHSDGRLKSSQVATSHIQSKSNPGDVISWSGCKDSQTSADTTNAQGVAVGAMSHAFMTCLRENPNIANKELLQTIRRILRKDFSQKPQLSSSHPVDMNLKFIM
ncbi:hypothetical protein CERSUDRAFT_161724 [Gelatoporia subvermispora B]|uniref:Peptidase C14 caspase domain-containing protein n=1 Tax=Ceriporiopsis subvermispora (strain B) TaxID=914234 RepID=M2R293_CERS8|nr:hypothetical protein CERSUDRAFT_161724 [Gelatoporia subvermispora B]